MRLFTRRLASLLAALLILLTALPVSSVAGAVQNENVSSARLTGLIHVGHKGSKHISDVSSTNQPKRTGQLPSRFSSKDLGYITSIKSQAYGDCWAHAAMASIEANMIKDGTPVGLNGELTSPASTSLNLSENHHVYFAFKKSIDKLGLISDDKMNYSDDPFDLGGNGYLSMFSLMRWIGPGNEETPALKYKTTLNKNTVYDDQYAYAYDASHVMNVIIIPCSDRDGVKQAIMEYGAGDFSYCDENGYVNADTGAYYYPQTITGDEDEGYAVDQWANHAVTVVGWDDDYPVSNFRSGKRPKNPGAWIIKNSWGTGVGDGGYYYISYEDSASYIEDVFFYDAEPIDNYDNIYQYDGTTNFNSDKYYAQGSSLATVFTSFGVEDLKAVSIATWDEEVSYELKVYLNPSTSDPTSGELKASKTGVLNYGGYQTIPLDSPVRLSMGDRYSVVFTLTTEEGEIMLPVDIVGNYSASDWGLSYFHALHESSCFVNESGTWFDKSSLYNFRMKAYTDDVPEDPVSVETTFHVDAGAPPAPLSGTAGVTEITLPAPETVPDGWSFSGWALQPVSATTEKPALYTAGSTFRLTARISDLYAVYEKTESDPGSAELRIVDSINIGDTLYLVSEDAKTELSAISSTNTKYGIGSSYSDLPSKLFPLVVENGTESGSYAFKNGSNYLTWVTGNSLSLSSSVTAGSSWTVTFDADKNASIKNKADEARVIWWNVRSPRFAAYTNKSEGADFYCTQFYRYGAASTTTYDSYPNGNYMIGDLDEDQNVTPDDALLLVYHVYFPGSYSVSQPIDFNKDGESDAKDALYLMYYIAFPDLYPLN